MLQPHTREHASRPGALGARTGRRPRSSAAKLQLKGRVCRTACVPHVPAAERVGL